MTDKENIDLAYEAPPDLKYSDSSPVSTPTRKPLGNINMDSPFRQLESGNGNGGITPTPKKGGSSRVIEALQNEIDELKSELFKVKNRNDELKKANEIIKRRRDQLVEQISNVKHENETVNSLLERKQRRITDLEAQLNDSMSSTDDLNFRVRSLESRCSKLQESEMSVSAEFERMKIAYDTVVSGQKEYRDHYKVEVAQLREKIQGFMETKDAEITKNIGLINKSDATIFRSIKSITIRAKDIESKYEKRDEELTKKVDLIRKTSLKNNRDTDALLKASRELFFDVADQLKIDHAKLLEMYLAGAEDQKNPFEEQESQDDKVTEEVTEQEFTDAAEVLVTEAQQIEVSKEATPEGQEKADTIVVKKRSEKKLEQAQPESLEQRMASIGKELNSSIPITDRVTKLDSPVKRTRSVRKTRGVSPQHKVIESRRSSRIFDEHDDTSSKSSNASRRSSRMFEKSHSRRTSVIGPVPELQHVTTDQAMIDEEGKKKKRRRRRRKTSKPGENNEDMSDAEHTEDESPPWH